MKNKILIRYKIFDFIGKKVWEVIDCTTKAGMDRYELLFDKKLFNKSRKNNTIVLKTNQMLLKWFLYNDPILNDKRMKKRFYKRHYIPTNIQDIDEYILPIIDELSFESNSGYDGSLYQLFLAAELQYFDRLQESQNIKIRNNHCDFKDIIKLEIARIRLGFNEIDQFLKKLNNWIELVHECGIESKYIPSDSYYYKILNLIGHSGILGYFLHLQEKCRIWNLYDEKVDMWDGRFLFSYESQYNFQKKKNKKEDERGVYVHNSKYFGIGVLVSRVINLKYRLPKYYTIINPQYNDNQIFQNTFKDMISHEILPAEIFLADGGPKSKETRELVKFFDSTPIIKGPKNAAGKILVTEKKRKFYADYIDPKYWLVLDSLYDLRTNVEQSFGYDLKVYHVQYLNRMSYEANLMYIGLVHCQSLLTALAAVTMNQTGLITRPGSFRNFSLYRQSAKLEEIQIAG